MQTENKSTHMLEIEDLHVSFFTHAGEVKAVNGIDFILDEGEVLGIVGESGSGKSVTVNALMRLVSNPGRITQGRITYLDRDITSMSEADMLSVRGREMAMIFQDPMTSLNPVFTIGNQLMETLLQHTGKTKQEAYEHSVQMLRDVGINNPEQRMKQYPHEFSGGMRQRVMIAMGLCCQPKLLIADEPTTALDVTIQAQILDLIKQMKGKTDTAVILITHDLGIVSDICDKVIVMYAGKVVEQGNIYDIFRNPSHPYTKGLLACLPRLDDEERKPLTPIEGQPVDMLNVPPGCSFSARCDSCMKVCLKDEPPLFDLGEDHYSSCWLHTIENK